MAEVLVALIVITVGLLGVAKMQALALASTTCASQRSIAAFEAASLAAVMHTNRSYWAGTPPTQLNVTTTVGGSTSITSNTAGFPPSGTQNCTPSGSAPCNPTTLAAYDLQQWAAAVNEVLPNSATTITCSTGSAPPLSCSIQITWTENAVAINSTESTAAEANAANPAQFQTPTYTLYVDP